MLCKQIFILANKIGLNHNCVVGSKQLQLVTVTPKKIPKYHLKIDLEKSKRTMGPTTYQSYKTPNIEKWHFCDKLDSTV